MGNRPMLDVGKQILLADIGYIAAVGIFGEKVVKGLVLGGAYRFRDGLVPFVAIGKYRIDVEYYSAKIEDSVAHNIADGELRFDYFRWKNCFHTAYIISICRQINLALGKAKNMR